MTLRPLDGCFGVGVTGVMGVVGRVGVEGVLGVWGVRWAGIGPVGVVVARGYGWYADEEGE